MPVTKGSPLDPARTRAAVLHRATAIFYARGLDGVGVAELCSTMGISKETLYRHFGSKEGLIEAVLKERSERVTRWLSEAAEAAGSDPRARLAAVFDALASWHGEPGFRGCAILNAATQHHGAGGPDEAGQHGAPREVAARHLERRLALLTDIARDAGAAQPEVLGRQFLMLVTGATIVADHHPGTPDAARHARTAALALLDAATHPDHRP
ncbi:TetR/AcrR family transcriptional regulator [Nonomuraea soli]|uniref:AcrR family transcriptional regulator n=1 Tax=Nonomuraea soli TaxID=1032476 RepID=A0A7W0CP22_9ACTN|nr:TetR/AcrR family transcriptional regulator [Nonomuraea soli]MBA2894584.1 AcrR family transcriptional regulator [Nonomuraea soli]